MSEYAKSGTSVPNDNPTQTVLPSVPNPAQKADIDSGAYSTRSVVDAASNPTDIPRSNADTGLRGDIVSGTGNPVPASVDSKRATASVGDKDLAKGSLRMEKHARQKGSDLERAAGEGAEFEAAPGEEQLSQEGVRANREVEGA